MQVQRIASLASRLRQVEPDAAGIAAAAELLGAAGAGEPELVPTKEDEGPELVVPLPVPGGAMEHAQAFRRLSEAITAELGPADILGSYGSGSGPFARPVDTKWGAPFARWHGERNALELRSDPGGLVLANCARYRWSLWYDFLPLYGNWELTGFIGVRYGSGIELDHTEPDFGHGWDGLEVRLAAFLDRLSFETLALGLRVSTRINGFIPSEDDWAFLFDICCADHLYLAHRPPPDTPGADALDLGWADSQIVPAGAMQGVDEGWYPFAFDAGAAGGVRSTEAARLLVSTARAMGVTMDSNLVLDSRTTYDRGYALRLVGFPLRA